MSEGRTNKISELPTVNSVSNSDVIIVNANTGSSVNTSQITVANFIRSAYGNVSGFSDVMVFASGNTTVVANGTQNTAYFTYDRTVYSSVELTFDMYSNTDGHKTIGTVICTSNSTIANCASAVMYVNIGGSPVINPQKSANVSGNNVTIYLDGPTGNVQVRYLAKLFKV